MQEKPRAKACPVCKLSAGEQADIAALLPFSEPSEILCAEYGFTEEELRKHFAETREHKRNWKEAERRRELDFWPEFEDAFALLLPRADESFGQTIRRRLEAILARITIPEECGIIVPSSNPNALCHLTQAAAMQFLFRESDREYIFLAYARVLRDVFRAVEAVDFSRFSNRDLCKAVARLANETIMPGWFGPGPPVYFQTMVKTYGNAATTLAMICASGAKVVGDRLAFEFSEDALKRFGDRQLANWLYFRLWGIFEAKIVAACASYKEIMKLMLGDFWAQSEAPDERERGEQMLNETVFKLAGKPSSPDGKIEPQPGMLFRIAKKMRLPDVPEECIPAALGMSIARWRRKRFKSSEDLLAALLDNYQAYKNCWRDVEQNPIDFFRKEPPQVPFIPIDVIEGEESLPEEVILVAESDDFRAVIEKDEWKKFKAQLADELCGDDPKKRFILDKLLEARLEQDTRRKRAPISNGKLAKEWERQTGEHRSAEHFRPIRNELELEIMRVLLRTRSYIFRKRRRAKKRENSPPS